MGAGGFGIHGRLHSKRDVGLGKKQNEDGMADALKEIVDFAHQVEKIL